MKTRIALRLCMAELMIASPAFGADITVEAYVTEAQGHVQPLCRMVILRRADNGTIFALRIPGSNNENAIMAVALTAVTSGLKVVVNFDPAATTGCGPEPAISYIGIRHS